MEQVEKSCGVTTDELKAFLETCDPRIKEIWKLARRVASAFEIEDMSTKPSQQDFNICYEVTGLLRQYAQEAHDMKRRGLYGTS